MQPRYENTARSLRLLPRILQCAMCVHCEGQVRALAHAQMHATDMRRTIITHFCLPIGIAAAVVRRKPPFEKLGGSGNEAS